MKPDGRTLLRWGLAALYGAIGVTHFAATDTILLIVPSWVPQPRAVVILTGLCELLGAVGLLIPRLRWLAGLMMAAYALCVFPANVKHAFEGIDVPGLPSSWWYHAPRLTFQPVLIWLALFASGVVDWPKKSLRRYEKRL